MQIVVNNIVLHYYQLDAVIWLEQKIELIFQFNNINLQNIQIRKLNLIQSE
jgi:hypothetical protein